MMKRYLTLTLTLTLIAISLFSMSFKGNHGTRFMEWKWSDCEQQAKIRNKPIFVFIGATYCNLSARMAYVFKQKEVGELLNENFVCNKMTTEGILNNFRASNWGVSSVPSYLFFTSKGKLVYKVEGFKDKDAMIAEIQTGMQKLSEAK